MSTFVKNVLVCLKFFSCPFFFFRNSWMQLYKIKHWLGQGRLYCTCIFPCQMVFVRCILTCPFSPFILIFSSILKAQYFVFVSWLASCIHYYPKPSQYRPIFPELTYWSRPQAEVTMAREMSTQRRETSCRQENSTEITSRKRSDCKLQELCNNCESTVKNNAEVRQKRLNL